MAAADCPGTIVFAHANGFPAGVYNLLFAAWRAAGYRVIAPPRLGHNPAFPVASNWRKLRDELLAFVDKHETVSAGEHPDTPQAGPGSAAATPRTAHKLHLVGHSMGGYLCLLAACKRPQAVASLTLIDAPLVRGWRAHGVRAMKLTGLMHKFGPGKVAITRRQHWPSKEAAHAHFAVKAAFARWHPQVLDDYVEHGMEALVVTREATPHRATRAASSSNPGKSGHTRSAGAGGTGVQLSFRREVETRIYNTLPHHFDAVLRRHPLQCPASYIGGTQSIEGRRAGLAGTRAVVHERIQWVEGSHLFPMEQPEATAQAVLRAIKNAAAA